MPSVKGSAGFRKTKSKNKIFHGFILLNLKGPVSNKR